MRGFLYGHYISAYRVNTEIYARGVLKTLSNIYDGAFSRWLLSQKAPS